MSPVNANSGEYKSKIGLDDLYIAQVTQDDVSGYVADTPEFLAPSIEATVAITTNEATQYAGDKPYESMSFEGTSVVTLTITGLPSEMKAKLLGRVFDAVSGRVFNNPEATQPYFALSFRSLKSNGSYKYIQYLKGRFATPSEDSATKTDSPDPKTTTLVYTAIPTIYEFDLGSITNSVKSVEGDQDTDNFDETGWFAAVQIPSFSAPSALALSSSTPTDGTTGVSVSADQTLTFNNALNASAIYNVVLVEADGTVIAGAISIDATKKIITINPTSNLDASTVYIITYAVTDIYGDTLAGAINFTTA